MKLKYILTLSTFIFSSALSGKEQSNIAASEIQAVENGLRGSVIFEGDATWNIAERMQHYGVPGVSLAVIKDFKIHWVKHYGVTDKETGKAVNAKTLFQAGSISKPVAAYGALKMVEENQLSLDAPVNKQLQGWQIPENQFTKKQPVTLRYLLNHSAGLTVHGFGGYSPGEPVPTTIQILNGEAPANSAAVRVDMQPGTQYRYSGGGYTVLQKLVADVSNKKYPKIMDDLVLSPLKMTQSTYLQPLPPKLIKYAAAGYLPNKEPVPGKRHTYPEMAAAGLWTTAEDLAKFAIDIQLGVKNGKSQILSQAMVSEMLTPYVSDNTGLGLFLQNKAGENYFAHGGWDEGFSADFQAHKTRGYGVVIMTNSNHPAFINELKNSVAAAYKWHNFLPPNLSALPMSGAERKRVVGQYRFTPDMSFVIFEKQDRLFMQYLNGEPMEVFKVGENQYIRREFESKFRFEQTENDGPINFVFGVNQERDNIKQRMKKGEKVPFAWIIDGKFKAAEAAYIKLFSQNWSSRQEAEQNLLTQANQLNTMGDKDSALQVLLICQKLFPASTQSLSTLAFHYKKSGQKNKAKSLFEQVLKFSPQNTRIKKALKDLTLDE